MRKILPHVFVVLMMLPLAARTQVFDGLYTVSNTIGTFTNDSIPNFIPDTTVRPLWQIGHSHKSFFGLDSTGKTTIMTDTVNPYPTNANNWFVIKVPHTSRNPIVNIWHKYQTDSGNDGGIVEFSIDTGITWQNVKGACNSDGSFPGYGGVLTSNFYSSTDTLITGDPAFTGNFRHERLSRFQFFDFFPERTTSGAGCSWERVDTFYVRFRFASDSFIDFLAGWEIDSFSIQIDYYGGSVAKINKSQFLRVYPNPSYDGIFTFPAHENEQEYTTEVYNAMGQKVIALPYNHSLDLSHYARGLYFYKVTGKEEYFTGQLLLE